MYKRSEIEQVKRKHQSLICSDNAALMNRPGVCLTEAMALYWVSRGRYSCRSHALFHCIYERFQYDGFSKMMCWLVDFSVLAYGFSFSRAVTEVAGLATVGVDDYAAASLAFRDSMTQSAKVKDLWKV